MAGNAGPLRILRPDDLLVLTVHLANLEVRDDRTALRRVDAAEPAALVFEFPPQHQSEQAFMEWAGGNEPAAPVRVWLERGWWSSGADEKLAVVIGSYLVDSSEPVHQLMTFVGQDMTRGGGTVASREEDSFPNRAGEVTKAEADAVVLAPSFDGPVATWTGRVDVEPTPDGAEQRLLVVEEDRLPVDEQTPSVGGFVDRIVYAAAVAL